MPSVSCGVNNDVPIILISGALRIGYSRTLMCDRVYDDPLVDGIDWSNNDKRFLPAKLFYSNLTRAIVGREQNISGINVSPVIKVIATSNILPPEQIYIHEQIETAHINKNMKRTFTI
jgi:hypothetical protein